MITSTQNQRIREVQKLGRKRYRTQSGLLLIEGVRLIEDVLASDVQPISVFFAPDEVAKNARLEKLVQALQKRECALFPCTNSVLRALSETQAPQGIAAVVPQPQLSFPNFSTLALILDRVRDPGNAGTLLRTAEAAGVDLVLFAPETVDPFNDKVIRAAMGAHFRLPMRVCQSWEAIQSHLATDQDIYVAVADGRTAYDAVNWSLPAALVVGGEAEGASKGALDVATPLSIPMRGHTESLNAAVAGAIILFEAARQRRVICD
jgi:TrmH family RNA methyltransferase